MPLFGETTQIGQKFLDLADAAANGVYGHVGLSADRECQRSLITAAAKPQHIMTVPTTIASGAMCRW